MPKAQAMFLDHPVLVALGGGPVGPRKDDVLVAVEGLQGFQALVELVDGLGQLLDAGGLHQIPAAGDEVGDLAAVGVHIGHAVNDALAVGQGGPGLGVVALQDVLAVGLQQVVQGQQGAGAHQGAPLVHGAVHHVVVRAGGHFHDQLLVGVLRGQGEVFHLVAGGLLHDGHHVVGVHVKAHVVAQALQGHVAGAQQLGFCAGEQGNGAEGQQQGKYDGKDLLHRVLPPFFYGYPGSRRAISPSRNRR